MRLAVDQRSRTVRLSLAPRAPLRHALLWADTKRVWVEDAIARLPHPLAIVPGMRIEVGGRSLTLCWASDFPRRATVIGDQLRISGPREGLEARVLRWLKAQAAAVLERETRALARRHDIVVGRVTVGDPRSRWGSCSATGDIRYSWRLILAPPEVLSATVAHEVAHRIHMNHGPAFHALAAAMLGHEPVAERAWLRTHGAALHGFGRGA